MQNKKMRKTIPHAFIDPSQRTHVLFSVMLNRIRQTLLENLIEEEGPGSGTHRRQRASGPRAAAARASLTWNCRWRLQSS